MSADNDILFERDLAKVLNCSVTTIKTRLRTAPHRLPPQTHSINRRPRWYRPTVDAWLAEPPARTGFHSRRRAS